MTALNYKTRGFWHLKVSYIASNHIVFGHLSTIKYNMHFKILIAIASIAAAAATGELGMTLDLNGLHLTNLMQRRENFHRRLGEQRCCSPVLLGGKCAFLRGQMQTRMERNQAY